MRKLLTIFMISLISGFLYADIPTYDLYHRLKSYPGKQEVKCPIQNNDLGVILIIGQSNTGNHAEKRMVSRHQGNVYNYYMGKCFEASSPLLGTTGDGGEFMTPLADYLIDMGVFKNIILIPSGISGSLISSWTPGGNLNAMLGNVLLDADKLYQLTEVVWHQGESDYLKPTPPESYKQSFYSLVSFIREGRMQVPIYYAVATRCGLTWNPDNPIAKMQASLALPDQKIYLGVNTDLLVPADERQNNTCHFREPGQLKTAFHFALAIAKNHGLKANEDSAR